MKNPIMTCICIVQVRLTKIRNEKTHPGEKRLIQLVQKECAIIPANFEENLNRLFMNMMVAPANITKDLDNIINEIKKILS